VPRCGRKASVAVAPFGSVAERISAHRLEGTDQAEARAAIGSELASEYRTEAIKGLGMAGAVGGDQGEEVTAMEPAAAQVLPLRDSNQTLTGTGEVRFQSIGEATAPSGV
jgi:hypothetical protein